MRCSQHLKKTKKSKYCEKKVVFFLFTYIYIYIYFFFQAEDGIRDAQESRGLGDVYKRQYV